MAAEVEKEAVDMSSDEDENGKFANIKNQVFIDQHIGTKAQQHERD